MITWGRNRVAEPSKGCSARSMRNAEDSEIWLGVGVIVRGKGGEEWRRAEKYPIGILVVLAHHAYQASECYIDY